MCAHIYKTLGITINAFDKQNKHQGQELTPAQLRARLLIA